MSFRKNEAFAISHAYSGAVEGEGPCSFFDNRQLGNSKAMNSADVIRAVHRIGSPSAWHSRDLHCQTVDVTKSWATFEDEGQGEHVLRAGSCVLQPPKIVHREIRHSDDLELIEITSPATFTTQEEDAR